MARGRDPRIWVAALVTVVALLVALVVVQLVRAVPRQTLSVPALAIRVPGSASLPWPSSGEAAVTIEGLTAIRTAGVQTPVPIASLAKMMTALLVLRDHPLSGAAAGPTITVTAADAASYEADRDADDSVLEVVAGEVLTERQALEGLLLPSADNIADLLAQWDAGSVPAFVAEMNSAARAFGMLHTTYTDPSGLDATTVSTARDQLLIASAAMSNPVFASIVAMPSANFPVAGTQQNFDYDVGHDGIIGVKTGSDSAAQGCWAFAATRPLGGMSYPELGVVLGIPATSEGLLEPALSAGLALANALPATVREVTAVPAGTVVAYVRAPWRSAVAIRTARALKGLVSVGQTVKPRFELHLPAGNTVARGRAVGTLTAPQVTGVDTAVLVTGSSGPGPSLFWRLTRL